MNSRFLFSFVGCLLYVSSSLGGLTYRTFKYDLSGKLIELNNADGTCIQYEYDSSNRLVKVVDSNSNTFRYQYDANNNCTLTEDNTGAIEYRYDLLNRLIAVNYPGIATNSI